MEHKKENAVQTCHIVSNGIRSFFTNTSKQGLVNVLRCASRTKAVSANTARTFLGSRNPEGETMKENTPWTVSVRAQLVHTSTSENRISECLDVAYPKFHSRSYPIIFGFFHVEKKRYHQERVTSGIFGFIGISNLLSVGQTLPRPAEIARKLLCLLSDPISVSAVCS